jgi:hypothetical protein
MKLTSQTRSLTCFTPTAREDLTEIHFPLLEADPAAVRHDGGPIVKRIIDQWAEYRRRRRFNRLLISAGFPAMIGISFISSEFGPRDAPDWILGALFAPWVIAAVVGRIRLIRWPCPRCGRPFFASWYNNEWADRCVNCKLDKWQ